MQIFISTNNASEYKLCLTVPLLLAELYHFNCNTANLKYFYYDILTEFYNILATSHLYILLSYDCKYLGSQNVQIY